jgi:hypothetical protein
MKKCRKRTAKARRVRGDVLDAVQRSPHAKCTQSQRRLVHHDQRYGGFCTAVCTPIASESAITFTRRSRQPCTIFQIVGRTTTLFTDEARFHRDRNTTIRKTHFWSRDNTDEVVQSNFEHRSSVTYGAEEWDIIFVVRISSRDV